MPAGRKPKFTRAEDMQVLIDAYFEDCNGHMLLDEKGKPILNKFGEPVIVGAHPPTMTGLALALGFETRQAIVSYAGKAEFKHTVAMAKLRLEAYTESRLFDRDGANGAKFSLQNNFKGWNDAAKEIANAGAPVIKLICDVPDAVATPKIEAKDTDGKA